MCVDVHVFVQKCQPDDKIDPVCDLPLSCLPVTRALAAQLDAEGDCLGDS